jgi:MFS family permease
LKCSFWLCNLQFSNVELRGAIVTIADLGKLGQHTAPRDGGRPTGHRAVLVVTCLALAIVVSAVASLNVAIPSIARDTHATQTQLSWMVDAYSLVFAALLLPARALGDRFGRRKALLAAQRAKALGIWSGVAGAAAILGLLTSGLVLQQWSWRSVFTVNIVLAVAAIIGTLRVVPESAQRDAPALDWTGAVSALVALGVLVYSIIEAPTAGWANARTLIGFGAGAILLAGFVGWELHTSHPLLDPRLLTHRAFTAGTLSIMLQFFAFFGFIFLLLQYLQLVLADSPLVAAVSLVPMAFGMMPSARLLAPPLVARAGTAAPVHSVRPWRPARSRGCPPSTRRADTGRCWPGSCRSEPAWA